MLYAKEQFMNARKFPNDVSCRKEMLTASLIASYACSCTYTIFHKREEWSFIMTDGLV